MTAQESLILINRETFLKETQFLIVNFAEVAERWRARLLNCLATHINTLNIDTFIEEKGNTVQCTYWIDASICDEVLGLYLLGRKDVGHHIGPLHQQLQ